MPRRKKTVRKKAVKKALKFTKISDKFVSIKRHENLTKKAQENQDVSEPINENEVLLQFDLNWEYGPCIGITRLERWERAEKLNLHPPKIVKEILEKQEKESEMNKCVWNYYYNVL